MLPLSDACRVDTGGASPCEETPSDTYDTLSGVLYNDCRIGDGLSAVQLSSRLGRWLKRPNIQDRNGANCWHDTKNFVLLLPKGYLRPTHPASSSR
jgi:hypothetical protein